MAIEAIPEWMEKFTPEDIEFVKKLILTSGSLKQLSRLYKVSYPTISLRLDRLIAYIDMADKPEPDPFIAFLKMSVIDGKLDGNMAKEIIDKYKQQTKKHKRSK